MKSVDIQNTLQLKHREYFRDNYLNPSLEQGFIEMTIPDKPNSSHQKYRLTTKGIAVKDSLLFLGTKNQVNEAVANYGSTNSTGEATGEATEFVVEEILRVVVALDGEMKRTEIQEKLDLKHDDFFRTHYIAPAQNLGYIDRSFPGSPNHPNQKYRLTDKGIALKNKLKNKK